MVEYKRGNRKPSSWGKPKSLLADNFWAKIEKANPNIKGRHTKKEWVIARDEFWGTVADIMIYQPNGVVLDGLGYFCFPAYSKKTKVPYKNKTTFKTKGLIYYNQFFGKIFNNIFLSGLSFELTRKQKKKWRHECDEGRQYLCHYKNIDNIVGNGTKRIHPTRTIYS